MAVLGKLGAPGQIVCTGSNTVQALTINNVGTTPQAIVSVVVLCNLEATTKTFRLAVIPASEISGVTVADKHWQFYDAPLAGNETKLIQIPWTLANGDGIFVAINGGTTLKVSAGVWAVVNP